MPPQFLVGPPDAVELVALQQAGKCAADRVAPLVVENDPRHRGRDAGRKGAQRQHLQCRPAERNGAAGLQRIHDRSIQRRNGVAALDPPRPARRHAPCRELNVE